MSISFRFVFSDFEFENLFVIIRGFCVFRIVFIFRIDLGKEVFGEMFLG